MGIDDFPEAAAAFGEPVRLTLAMDPDRRQVTGVTVGHALYKVGFR